MLRLQWLNTLTLPKTNGVDTQKFNPRTRPIGLKSLKRSNKRLESDLVLRHQFIE